MVDAQTRAGDYQDDFRAVVKLVNFVDLVTGECLPDIANQGGGSVKIIGTERDYQRYIIDYLIDNNGYIERKCKRIMTAPQP